MFSAHPRQELRRLALVATIAGASGACEAVESVRMGVVPVRDSAGIQIVTSSSPDDAASWRLEDEPFVRIGATVATEGPSDDFLFDVGDVLLLPDDRIVVVNGRTTLRFYGPDGSLERVVGREGDGPGEYRRITSAVFARDTIYVYDDTHKRVTLLSASGALLGDLPLPRLQQMKGGSARLRHVSTDGVLLFTNYENSVPRREEVGLYWATSPNIRVPPDGESADTIGFSGMEWITGLGEVMPPPFIRATHTAAGATRFVMTHGERFEIEVYDVDTGGLRQLIRLDEEPPPLDAEEYFERLSEDVRRDARAQAGADASPARVAAIEARLEPLVRAVEPNPTMPAWGQLFIDHRGALWAREASSVDQLFAIFDGSGRLLARAELPADLRVLAIGDDVVAGVERDAFDVETVVLHALRRE